ncbi:MAG: DUF3365 domain-containing protein [Pirellulaceae bacterium]|nr:DUF3365 domain-containing protein [Pirellulaceae bacterium]
MISTFLPRDQSLAFATAEKPPLMKRVTNWICVLATLGATLFAGCGQGEPSVESTSWKSLTTLTAHQQRQKTHALEAKELLSLELSSELKGAMADPAAAISVCKTSAPTIATRVGSEKNVRMGRTSFRIRNLNNQPPQWAVGFVKERVNDEVTLQLPNNGLGVLLPIRVQTICINCHGQPNEMDPSIFAAVLSNYPDDNATGFKVGDLRGYFWIEVPPMDP